jgi:hypothetical protein
MIRELVECEHDYINTGGGGMGLPLVDGAGFRWGLVTPREVRLHSLRAARVLERF